jgi:glutamine transport system substrate-binding protein
MIKVKKIVLSSVLLLSMAALAACGGGAKESTAPAEKPAEEKILLVGTDAAYPPFEKQEGDKITGFDIDVINAIAEAQGFTVKVEHMGWDPLFEGIDTGKADLGISAITINDERKQSYDFSEPYFEAKQLILVPEGSDVTKLDDLAGKKIGVQSATTGEDAVKEKFGLTYEGIKGYDDTPAAVDDLLNGRVDAVVADNAVLLEYVKTIGNKGFKVVDDPSFEPEFYGIMVKKGNTEVLTQINEGLKKIKENGKYDEIFNQYFGE